MRRVSWALLPLWLLSNISLVACSEATPEVTLFFGSTSYDIVITKHQGQPLYTNSFPIQYTVTFSQPIDSTTFEPGDIINLGEALSVTWTLTNAGDDRTFTLSATSATEGRIIPYVSPGAVFTTDGEPLGDSSSNAVVYYDNTSPTVTVNQATGQPDPTYIDEIVFAIEFSEPIDTSSFDVSDITFSGTPDVGGATLVNQGDNRRFLLVTNSITGDGVVMASLDAGKVLDLAGNGNGSSSSTDNQVLLDRDAPEVLSVSSLDPDGVYVGGETITIQVVFDQTVFVAGSPTITLETGVTDNKAFYWTGSGTNTLQFLYTIGVSDLTGDLEYVATTALSLNGGIISDDAGNMAILTLPSLLSSNSLGGSKNFVIIGTPATLEISGSNPYNFGDVSLGDTQAKTFTLTNIGVYAATSLSGSGLGGPFRFEGGNFPGTSGTCTTSLGAGDSCTFVVEFQPTLNGLQGGSLTISYHNGAETTSVSHGVTGNGLGSNMIPEVIAVTCPRAVHENEAVTCESYAAGIDTDDTPNWMIQNNNCSGASISINPTTGNLSLNFGASSPRRCSFEVAVDDGFHGPSVGWRVEVDVYHSTGLTHIESGRTHTCAVYDGRVRCWGENTSGALGDNNVNAHSYLARTVEFNLSPGSTLQFARQTTAGDLFGCARIQSGSAVCWGRNDYGQIGSGSVGGIAAGAVPVGSLSNVVQIAAGANHACALINGGSAATRGQVHCWGRNNVGQVGIGSITTYETSPKLALTSGAVQIVAGNDFSCALIADRSISCWGSNADGALGSGSPSNALSATPVKGFGYGEVEAIEITAGDRHVCARTVDNRLKCWGYNSYGQLGLGHSTNVGRNSISEMLSLPYVQLGTGRTVKSITAGPTHTCAVLDNDTIKCWGSNMDGKLGIGSTMDVGGNPGEMGDALPSVNLGSSNPLPLMTSISSYATCALLEVSGIRDVRCWGSNNLYALGHPSSSFSIGSSVGDPGDAMVAVDFTAPNASGHVVFVTSTTYLGNLGGLSGADATCAVHASNAGLPHANDFKAILSSSSEDAHTRFSITGTIQNRNGDTVANNDTDFWSGSLNHSIQYDEYGAIIFGAEVWTNTSPSGWKASANPADSCNDWASDSSTEFASTGLADSMSSGWMAFSSSTCDLPRHLYCIGPK